MNQWRECKTLSKHRPFRYSEDPEGINITAGEKWGFKITWAEWSKILTHFKGRKIPLGNCVDNLKTGGLGEYVRTNLNVGAKAASHIAAIMVQRGEISYEHGPNNSILLKF